MPVIEDYMMKNKVKIGFIPFDTKCWKCKKNTTALMGIVVEKEGKYFYYKFGEWLKNILEIIDVKNCFKNNKIGTLKYRYSRTQNKTYYSNGCYYCDVLLGKFYLQMDFHEEYPFEEWSPETVCKTEIESDILENLLINVEYRILTEEFAKNQNKSEYNEMLLDESESNEENFEDDVFSIENIKFTIKKRSLFELYRGNDFLGFYMSIEEAKNYALKYTKCLASFKKD